MRALVALHPQLSENALKVVLQYLRDYANRHSRLATKSAEERLADVLLILGHQQGQVWGGRVELEATNEQLSALADVSLFTTSRSMSKWARKGFISKERGKVFIRTPEGLVAD
jgi:CRP-like cAMP-binding protein